MKYIKFGYYIFFSLTLNLCACAQNKHIFNTDSNAKSSKIDSNFTLIKTINGNFSYFDVDVLDNIYLINQSKQLKKINANGDSVAVYNNVKKFGNPTSINVSNPLKILLFYKSYSTIITLDRFLSLRNTINLKKLNIFNTKTIATSYDNNIWLFDEQEFKLKKINDDGIVLSESNDWRQIFENVPSPTEIFDQNGFVYLYDPNNGFYVFDYYGSLKSQLPFLHWKNVSVSNNNIYGFVQNTMQSYQLKSMNIKTYNLSNIFDNSITIRAINGKLYLLKSTGLEIYQIK
ncbi:MAG: hypothetical protein ABL929_02335 [Ferruginibacter sp.]|nr:hypothetical protein [Ferruginibacter sp.]